MKKILLLVAIFTLQLGVAQEKTSKKTFFMEPMGRVYVLLPNNSGDNYLGDANKNKLSFGLNLSMFEYQNFRFIIGFDHLFYEVTDHYKAADVGRTVYNGVHADIGYGIPIVNDLSVQTYVGIGWAQLGFKRSGDSGVFSGNSVDSQQGTDFRVGTYIDYKFDKFVSVFAGINYVASKYPVNTAAEFEDYFGKAKMTQISVGLKIGFSFKDKQQEHAN